MKSKPLQEAHQVAEAFVRRLNEIAKVEQRHDPRFNYAVQVIHTEGTHLFFDSAFVIRWGIWQIIIPEHHDIHIYPLDEARVRMFRHIDEETQDLSDEALVDLGLDPTNFKWGPDPYGDLKRKAEEDAALDAEDASADSNS